MLVRSATVGVLCQYIIIIYLMVKKVNVAIFYLLVINVFATVLCVADKQKAKKGAWRISEKMLFTVSLIGGSVSMYITMLLIRHKTQHKRFMLGLPIIILSQYAFLILILHIFA